MEENQCQETVALNTESVVQKAPNGDLGIILDLLFASRCLTYDHPRAVIPKLCRLFHGAGWMAGSGGALSVRYGDKIYTTPSGVQKECVEGEDLFVQTISGEPCEEPPSPKSLKRSTCTPLITAVYREQKDVGAVFHLHTKSSVLATIVHKGVEMRIAHQQLIKVIKKSNSDKNFGFKETLVIPIIENKSTEDEIEDSLVRAMKDYPETSAILIRRHGLYVWGPTWQRTKIMAEAYDFLFDVTISMMQLGLDPTEEPVTPEGAYT